MVKLTILESFLHGDLKPWKFDLSNQRRFTNLLAGNITAPNNYAALIKQLKALLADYPILLTVLETESKMGQPTLTGHFYETTLPIYNNPAQNYCTQVITLEALRFLNQFLSLSSSWTDAVDRIYHTRNILTSIRVLASQISTELQEEVSLATPNVHNSFNHYTLTVLRQKLVGLFFDIQEIFKTELPETETEQSFYVHHLNEPYPNINRLKPGPAFFEFKVKHLLKNKFEKIASTTLLAEMRSLPGLQNLQTALENYTYLQIQNIEAHNSSIESLTDPENIKRHYVEDKFLITSKINQYTYGHQRLEVVESAINELRYIQSEHSNNESIPALLSAWLQNQRAVYSQHAGNVFAIEAESSVNQLKKEKPKTRIDKNAIDANKQLASENLKFLSGFNLQQHKIMPDTDFNRLIEYTFCLVETGKLPHSIKPIPQIGIASNHLRYTFYLIHKGLYGTKEIKKEWIDFLHGVFKQFENSDWQTTKTKFSSKPNNYNSDMKTLAG